LGGTAGSFSASRPIVDERFFVFVGLSLRAGGEAMT
jgi:hypothetical protein